MKRCKMELREFAERVLLVPDLDVKLQKPADLLTDNRPGEPIRANEPARPPNLQFAERRTAPNMPHANTFGEVRKRGIAHHIMANHELQALEVMAWTLLAFPEASHRIPPRIGCGRLGRTAPHAYAR